MFVDSDAGRDAGRDDLVARLNERDATALYNGVIVDIPSLYARRDPIQAVNLLDMYCIMMVGR